MKMVCDHSVKDNVGKWLKNELSSHSCKDFEYDQIRLKYSPKVSLKDKVHQMKGVSVIASTLKRKSMTFIRHSSAQKTWSSSWWSKVLWLNNNVCVMLLTWSTEMYSYFLPGTKPVSWNRKKSETNQGKTACHQIFCMMIYGSCNCSMHVTIT